MKTFKVYDGIGKAKHLVSFHDGTKTNLDGSEFFDIKIFKNKVMLNKFIKELHFQGYIG